MGHIHLRVLPGTKLWGDVVDLLNHGATDRDVVRASAQAAERDLLTAVGDPVYVEAVRLLLAIPLAARQNDFGQALREIDLRVPDRPALFDVVSSVTDRLDTVAARSGRLTDLGEIAGHALTRSLSEMIGDRLPGLFDATPEDFQGIVRKLSFSKGIAELARDFYGHVVGDSLSYWLDRTLANQIGQDLRFATTSDRVAFDRALGQFTAEATRIIQEFSGGWYGKTLHERGGFDSHAATVFGAVALKKIVEELRMKGTVDV